ncbi:hypothetical protein U1T56_22815 [Geminicoccaceae bacterium SYSU G07066]|uniref:Uncharacterized protein n=1 Tax=Benzoatithermus flavus TaxID=3108223 RepID=A0ABU8XZV2_9PROT
MERNQKLHHDAGLAPGLAEDQREQRRPGQEQRQHADEAQRREAQRGAPEQAVDRGALGLGDLAQEHVAAGLGQHPHRHAGDALPEPEPAGGDRPVQHGDQDRGQHAGDTLEQGRGCGEQRIAAVRSGLGAHPPPAERAQQRPIGRPEAAPEDEAAGDGPQAVAQDEGARPAAEQAEAELGAGLGRELDEAAQRVAAIGAAADRPVRQDEARPPEQEIERCIPEQGGEARHAEPGGERLAAEGEDENEQEVEQQHRAHRHRRHGERVLVVAADRHGVLVAQRHQPAEDGGERREHGEHAERLRPVEPGQDRRAGDEEELARHGPAREHGQAAGEAALRQEAAEPGQHRARAPSPRGAGAWPPRAAAGAGRFAVGLITCLARKPRRAGRGAASAAVPPRFLPGSRKDSRWLRSYARGGRGVAEPSLPSGRPRRGPAGSGRCGERGASFPEEGQAASRCPSRMPAHRRQHAARRRPVRRRSARKRKGRAGGDQRAHHARHNSGRQAGRRTSATASGGRP